MKTNKQAIIYARTKGTDLNNSEKLIGQLVSCLEWARENNIKILEEFRDFGISGNYEHLSKREGLQNLLRYLRRHKNEVQYVIMTNQDRLVNSIPQGIQAQHEIESYGVKLICVNSLNTRNKTDEILRRLDESMGRNNI